jgi:hypothetical protein
MTSFASELAALVLGAGFEVRRQSGMMPFDASLFYMLTRRCIPSRPLKRLMESVLSIHMGRMLKSCALVQLLVAVKNP